MKELTKKQKILRSLIVIFCFLFLILGVFLFLKFTGFYEKINSVQKLKDAIISFGIYGKIFFVTLQFLQVTFLPIPSTIVTITGALIYGALEASLLSFAGILLGSAFAFYLGQSFGKKLVSFMVGEQSCRKWTAKLNKAKYSFFIMMLLPFFPDDILCLVAGLTDMSWEFFIIVNLVSRPIGILITCYLGSGTLIPYSGWGIPVWIVIIIATLILLFLTTKYQDKIDDFITKKRKK